IAGKWGITLMKDVPETENLIRDGLNFSTKSHAKNDIKNMCIGMLRSQEGQLPRQVLEDYKVAQAGSTKTVELMRHALRDLVKPGRVSKESRANFDKYVAWERTARSVTVPSQIGRFARNIGEFEANWLAKIGKLPTEAETLAYRAY